MRAYKLHAPKGLNNLKLGDYDEPVVKDNEVKIQMKAASLNYRDTAVAAGGFSYPGEQLPLIPFSDGAGVVTEVGQSVKKVKPGDRVSVNFFPDWHGGAFSKQKTARSLGGSTDGILAEYVVFDENAVVKIPDKLSFEEAATFPCAGVTAWHALVVKGSIKAGDTVLVQGTGGVSVFGLQIAKLFGAKVIVTSSSNEKLDQARELGADYLINYKETPEWDEIALECTGGEGVDFILEVGGPGTLNKSLKAIKPGGSIYIIGAVGGGAPGQTDNIFISPLTMTNLQGIYVGSAEMLTEIFKAFAANQVKPVIGKTFTFDEVKDALNFMSSGSHFGKIVVSI
ncbi:NAD(P)-dependent alcohol dehydrogenase [Pontibacter silvestris]|uniref:NAD(P)-dependent alcohol dehydrogenase n=1 Tax=Pontibacter silvestris TaxID=2305183 RepID=A0ABW4X0M8_9BACT|nr:NAD(P)-dependent alcohol dehydrogenase [Pontibacter silvestris]MCC9136119.1 NAD(P)-dependent alcohol dehydrogenase [Pontibacter silvestris]